ncbi:hypothetical protein GOP47_0006972 [Adiantum capillus-veneris]|uniref:Uncharacterized protein n=1 Tax=Adiantum capillus-veneris TaxID=13818 RepID=A0A9D4V0P5_ADICA|nr:hypothetical protein GOP47_0006972 [Adiantum capillus-veneris]
MVPWLHNSAKSANKDRGSLPLHAQGGDELGMESGKEELVRSAWSIEAWLVSAPSAAELSIERRGREKSV